MKPISVLIPMLLLANACGSISKGLPQKSEVGTDNGGGCLAGANDGSGGDCDPSGADTRPSPPRATDSITIRGNLDPTVPLLNWNLASPATTSNLATNLVVYDSLGKPIQLDIYFSKNDAAKLPGDSGAWRYHVITDGVNVQFQADGATPAVPGAPTQIAAGILRFDTSGRLVSNVIANQGFYPKNARAPQGLTFNLGTGTNDGGSGLDGITQYVGTSTITFITQSGSPYIP